MVDCAHMLITDLKDATFLPSNLCKCLTQNTLVVNAEGCYACHDWFRDDVCAVVRAANSNFKDRCINLQSIQQGKDGEMENESL